MNLRQMLYSKHIENIAKAIGFAPELVGSAGDYSQMFYGDFDFYEQVPFKASTLRTFVKRVTNLHKFGKITDIKCGEVPEWNVVQGKTYSRTKCLTNLSKIWQDGIITDEEHTHAQSLLKPSLSKAEFLKVKKELRFGILRWTAHDVEKGILQYRKHTFYLDQACKSKGITKIDLLAWMGDKYTEVTNNIVWMKGSKPYASIQNLNEALSENILVYEAEGNWVKVGKRMISLAKNYGDNEVLQRLYNIFNSPLGQLYTVTSDLEVLRDYKNFTIPKRRRRELDLMRLKFAHLYFPELRGSSPSISILPKLNEILQSEMHKALREAKLLPVPKDYILH